MHFHLSFRYIRIRRKRHRAIPSVTTSEFSIPRNISLHVYTLCDIFVYLRYFCYHVITNYANLRCRLSNIAETSATRKTREDWNISCSWLEIMKTHFVEVISSFYPASKCWDKENVVGTLDNPNMYGYSDSFFRWYLNKSRNSTVALTNLWFVK